MTLINLYRLLEFCLSSDLVKYISFQRTQKHLISWVPACNSLLLFNSFETAVISEQLYLTFSQFGIFAEYFLPPVPLATPTAVSLVSHEILMPLSLQKYVFWKAQYWNLIQSPSLLLTRLQTDQNISYRTTILNNYFYIELLVEYISIFLFFNF